MPEQVEGWVFVGFPEEHLRPMLRPGANRLWDDARTIGKLPGQPVLFLQTREQGAAWVGSGVITGVEERWKAFGVFVETRVVAPRLLPTVAKSPVGHPPAHRPEVESIRLRGLQAWENRTLASRIGIAEFRLRTPYLEEQRDLRLTASDWNVLCALQPGLLELRPK